MLSSALAVKAIRKSPTVTIGFVLVGLWVVTALLAPWIAPMSPTDSDFLAIAAPPSSSHWLGTDQLGRDVFSRILYGGRSVLAVAPAATFVGMAVGTLIGLIAAYSGGWLDESIMRTLDALLAIPGIILASVILAMLGPSTINVVLVIGMIYARQVARTIRVAAIVESRKDYVDAAMLRGESTPYILLIEILPNLRGPLISEAATRFGYAIFTSATLGFLGLGIQPPTPDWGYMIAENQGIMTVAPWAILFPALAIASVVISVSLIVEGLSELEQ